MFSFPLLLTLYAGFSHAFEADHLLGVGNIVSQRKSILPAVKDGIFWGLGHSSTILIIGMLMLIFKVGIAESSFHYFEATVGLMLIVLALYRLVKYASGKKVHTHPHQYQFQLGHNAHKPSQYHNHQHMQLLRHKPEQNMVGHTHWPVHAKAHTHGNHKLAYGVGLVHGLAGSGALVVLVMAQMDSSLNGLLYLLIFSTGAIAGMLVAAGLLSVPFSKQIIQSRAMQAVLVILTSALCLIYGGKIIYENLTF